MTTPDDEKSAEDLITECVDVVALGYPYDGTVDEKRAFMNDLQRLFETRAPIVRGKVGGVER